MMLLMLSGQPRFICWIDFTPVFSCYVLLSPNLCFISFLYLFLYFLGDDAWIVIGISCKPTIYVS